MMEKSRGAQNRRVLRMFELLLLAVGRGITKHLLAVWLEEGMPNAIGGELIGALAAKLGQPEAKKATQRIERIRDGVIRELERFFVNESHGDASVERIAVALGRTLNAAEASAHLVKGRFDAAAVAQEFAATAPQARATLDPDEQRLYDHALRATAAALVRIAEELPNFQKTAFEEQLRLLDQLAYDTDAILKTIRPIASRITRIDDHVQGIHDRPALEAQGYDDDFRRTQRARVANLRLFGLPPQDNAESKFALKISYIPLHLDIANHDYPLCFSYPELMALLPHLGNRLLIEGPAGCGKTTLLQWTALTALEPGDSGKKPVSAKTVLSELPLRLKHPRFRNLKPEAFFPTLGPLFQREEQSRGPRYGLGWTVDVSKEGELHEPLDARPWWRLLPFFLRLRDCPEGRLPTVDELPQAIARTAGKAPEGWVRQKLNAGAALLLVDGIDEIPPDVRCQLHEDLDELTRVYPKTPLIATGRPLAVRDPFWAQLFKHRLVVEPMMHHDISTFIERWHEAPAARTSQPASDAAALSHQVLSTPALFQLAQTPLLCAAICYLHQLEGEALPRRAFQLYDAICRQLVHQLDVDRLKKNGYEQLVPALAGLDANEKLSLLARLALAMMRDEQAILPVESGCRVVKEGLAALGKSNPPDKVLAALQERSGVLRGASAAMVEFSHNALKTYLAAKRLAEESIGVREVIRLADATTDPELIVLFAAQVAVGSRESLIEALLEPGGPDEEAIRRRQILALRCSVGCLKSEKLRQRLQELLAAVSPPRSSSEATALAELGDRAVPYLGHRREAHYDWNTASLGCLDRIGTPQAKEMIESYLDTESPEIAITLANLVHPLRIRLVAANCLMQSSKPYDISEYISHKIRDIKPILGRKKSKSLFLAKADIGDECLPDIIKFQNLQTLYLSSTKVTDVGIERLSSLKELKELRLDGTKVTNDGLVYLAGMEKLQFLELWNTPVTDAGLAHLLQLPALQYLSVDAGRVNPDDPNVTKLRAKGVDVGF